MANKIVIRGDAKEVLKMFRDIDNAAVKTEQNVEKQTDKMSDNFKALGQVVKIAITTAAAKAFIGYSKSAEKTALSLEILRTKSKDVFDQLQDAEGATLGLANKFDMVGAANKALAFGIDLSGGKFKTLMKLTTKLSAVMGIEAKQAFDDLTTATGRQSKMIADNLGIILKLSDVNKAHARSIGKTVKELTQEEKSRAFLNEIIKQGSKSTALVTDQMIKNNTKLTKSYKMVETSIRAQFNFVTELAGHSVDFWVKQVEGVLGYTEVHKALNVTLERYARISEDITNELDWITKISGIEEAQNRLIASNIAYKKKIDFQTKAELKFEKTQRKANEKKEKDAVASAKRIARANLSTFESARDKLIDDINNQEKEIDGFNELSNVEKIKREKVYAKFKVQNSVNILKKERQGMLEQLEFIKLKNAEELDSFNKESAAIDREMEERLRIETQANDSLLMITDWYEQAKTDIKEGWAAKRLQAEKKAMAQEAQLADRHNSFLLNASRDVLSSIIEGNFAAIPLMLAQKSFFYGTDLIMDGIRHVLKGSASVAGGNPAGALEVTTGKAEIAQGTPWAIGGGLAAAGLNLASGGSDTAKSTGAQDRNDFDNKLNNDEKEQIVVFQYDDKNDYLNQQIRINKRLNKRGF